MRVRAPVLQTDLLQHSHHGTGGDFGNRHIMSAPSSWLHLQKVSGQPTIRAPWPDAATAVVALKLRRADFVQETDRITLQHAKSSIYLFCLYWNLMVHTYRMFGRHGRCGYVCTTLAGVQFL
jgi:hypothetical protein